MKHFILPVMLGALLLGGAWCAEWLAAHTVRATERDMHFNRVGIQGVPPKSLKLESAEGAIRTLLIDVVFSAETEVYPNIFQTGNSAQAIRLEVAPPSTLALALGESQYLSVRSPFALNRIHRCRIEIDSNSGTKVWLDGALVLRKSEITPEKGRFDLDDFVVGAGFAKVREHVGRVDEFSVGITYAPEPFSPFRRATQSTRVLGFGFIAGALVSFLGQRNKLFAIFGVLFTVATTYLAWKASATEGSSSTLWSLLSSVAWIMVSGLAWSCVFPNRSISGRDLGGFVIAGLAALACNHPTHEIVLWCFVFFSAAVAGYRWQEGPRQVVCFLILLAIGCLPVFVLSSAEPVAPRILPLSASLVGIWAVILLRLILRQKAQSFSPGSLLGLILVVTAAFAAFVLLGKSLIPEARLLHALLLTCAVAMIWAKPAIPTETTNRLNVIRWCTITFGNAVAAFVCMAPLFFWHYREKVPQPAGGKALQFDEWAAVFQSNVYEAISFFLSVFEWKVLLPLLAIPTIYCAGVALLSIKPGNGQNRRRRVLAGLALLLVVTGLIPIQAPLLRDLWIGYKRSYSDYSSFSERRLLADQRLDPSAKLTRGGQTYVVIIGESANRGHLGAYGYFRPTTPWLSRIGGGENAVLFTNAYSAYCHTVPSLLLALTQANQTNRLVDFDSPSVVAALRAVRAETHWLSEQGVSWTDNPLNVLARTADHTAFFRPGGAIVPAIRDTLARLDPSRTNVVFVHLIGSHAPYEPRVPINFVPEADLDATRRIMTAGGLTLSVPLEELEAYDRSIAYTDSLLAQIHASLESRPELASLMIYFSDHGEDVWGRRAHHASQFSFPMARIPFFLVASNEWRSQNPEEWNALRKRRDDPFTLDYFDDFLLRIVGVESTNIQGSFQLESLGFGLGDGWRLKTLVTTRELQTDLYTRAKEIPLASDPQKRSRDNLAALRGIFSGALLWNYADHPAAPEAAELLGLDGLEINITFPTLAVGHYPEVKSDFPLKTWFLLNPRLGKKGILWLDSKPMETGNWETSLKELDDLDSQYGIKSRTIFEGWVDEIALAAKKGWKVSFYFHGDRWPGYSRDASAEQLTRIGRELADHVKALGASALSFHRDYYGFIKNYVEPHLDDSIIYHTWSVSDRILSDPEIVSDFKASPIPKDPRVKTILLTVGFNGEVL